MALRRQREGRAIDINPARVYLYVLCCVQKGDTFTSRRQGILHVFFETTSLLSFFRHLRLAGDKLCENLTGKK